jgi:hypothetical protein
MKTSRQDISLQVDINMWAVYFHVNRRFICLWFVMPSVFQIVSPCDEMINKQRPSKDVEGCDLDRLRYYPCTCLYSRCLDRDSKRALPGYKLDILPFRQLVNLLGVNRRVAREDKVKYFKVHINWRRSQWPRGLRHEPSSLARTLGSWVRIPLEVWMSVCVYSVFVLGSGLETGWSLVQGVLPNVLD